ncbi:hypothetical protein J4E93_008667 [Alternaria ventricosa]|uniref:uncharacterized protein n=1 Tax=Alternaria ventricosa TaxID=1187951 RepID=UPI0020C45065|nr:uncharacterized protein J4E93_008667 [Alternaria ventricosa]KAI4640461.1 hypothetical protein J4E93_008667 [Alternaria ventricosa]
MVGDTYDAPPIAVGDSKRENSDKHSFLELPGEIRNQIYEYFVKSPSPLDVRYHGINCWTTTLYLRLNGEVRIPINIFLSCRKLYHEAASAFYGNNTFTLKPDDAGETNHSYIEIASIFITRLGSQAPWLSKLELDVSCLKGYEDHSCYEGNGSAFPSIKWKWDDIFEVMPLLRAIWSRNLKVLVSFNKVVDDSPQGFILRTTCDTTAMTVVFQSICQGQLQLQRYGQHLRAVALKRDGSGGVLCWGTTQPPPGPYYGPTRRFQANPDYLTDFIAEDNGSRLKLVTKRSTPLTLLTLPESLQQRIYSMVVHPVEGTSIDLDHDTKFRCGLVHVNRHFYDTWRDRFIFGNKFILTMTTRQMHTTFDDFDNLRTFLRKTYQCISSYSPGKPDTITAQIVTPDKTHQQPGPSYILRFETDSAVSLADVRINVLPFIMETSTTQATNTVMFQIWTRPSTDAPSTLITSHTMTIHKLRLNIVLAIMTHVYSDPRNLHSDNELPDFYINGFGEVVQTTAPTADYCSASGPWEPASSFVDDEEQENYRDLTVHPIDYVSGHYFHPDCRYP